MPRSVRPDELADAVVRLIEEPEFAKYLGENARRHVESHHSWDMVAEQTLEVYHPLGGGG